MRTRASKASAESVEAVEALGLTIRRPIEGGFYLWVDLPQHMAGENLVHDAARSGIFIAPAGNFSTEPHPQAAMRINVAYGANPVFLAWLRVQLSDKRS